MVHRARPWWLIFVGAWLVGSACVSVAPGQAVLVTTAGGVEGPLGEGVHLVPPLAERLLLDLRQQERNEALSATTADGAELGVGTSLITFRVAPEELLAFARAVGPDYYEVLVRPVISAHTRRALGQLRLADLDSERLRAAQDLITRGAAEELRPFHLVLERVELRDVAPRSARLREAYEAAAVLEQRVRQAADELRLARQRAEQRRTEAQGLAAANATLGPTLDPHVLADARARAFQALLLSPNTQVVQAGDVTQEVSP